MRRESVPTADDVLCERCGYLLNGLPPDNACPECGLPVAESTSASPRRPTAWESGRDHAAGRFQATAIAVFLHPRRFFRTMTAHGDTARSARFGLISLLPAMLLNVKAVLMHCAILHLLYGPPATTIWPVLLVAVPLAIVVGWAGMYYAVVRLTTIEARYWGMRLPTNVVRRAVHYDAVHASIASLLPWAVTLVYLCILIANDSASRWATTYLYALSLAVIVSAVYLFAMYATSMRSLMYANR